MCFGRRFDVPHAKQAALRRAINLLMVSSVQMQSPRSLRQVSMLAEAQANMCLGGGGGVVSVLLQKERLMVSIEMGGWMGGRDLGWGDRRRRVEMTMYRARCGTTCLPSARLALSQQLARSRHASNPPPPLTPQLGSSLNPRNFSASTKLSFSAHLHRSLRKTPVV